MTGEEDAETWHRDGLTLYTVTPCGWSPRLRITIDGGYMATEEELDALAERVHAALVASKSARD